MIVLVTGATGFIGNYVVEELLKQGIKVIATSTNIENAKSFSWYKKVTYLPYEIKGKDQLNLFEYFNKPDGVIHLAWKGLPNYTEHFHIEENLFNDYFFLKNLIENGLQNLTVTGTCFEYGMVEGCLSEDLITNPNNSYALAKDSLRKFLFELQKKYSFNLKWTRLFYMYGEGQAKNSIISQLNKAIEDKEKVFNMSGGDQERDYSKVEDVAKNIVAICLQNNIQGIINCCNGTPIKVKEFIKKYLENKNQKISLNLGFYPYSKLEPMNFWGDNSKLKKITNETKP